MDHPGTYSKLRPGRLPLVTPADRPKDRAMKIGVPKEIKIGETRVSMTPSLCRRCVSLGAKVVIQKSAGLSAGFTDAEYRAAGAVLAADAATVWKSADMV